MNNIDMSNVWTIGVGGDGMTNILEQEMNDFLLSHGCKNKINKGYGMTEIGAAAIIGFPHTNREGSVGIPLPHNNIMIYDRERHKELSYHQIGEICLNCPSRMLGYMNNEKATEELFWRHKDGTEWLHTEDLGYLDEDGFLYLAGRMKRIILTTGDGSGYKVFPNLVESLLEEHEDVSQSCIVGLMDNGNQVLKAFIVLKEGMLGQEEQIEQKLRQECDERFPVYSRPAFYEFCDGLPMTAAGKVDYRKLEEMANSVRQG